MKKYMFKMSQPAAVFSVSALSLAISMAAHGQIEELVVKGRLKDSAGDVVMQRIESEVSMDILSSELIGRIGDSDVAAALRRLPGVTTVDDKFVFVRGLGERYSKTLLNGAEVPSPDLTRSILPLDLFPTSIVKSLVVQKAHSADMPAQFGGGTVDIQTKGIPDEFVFSVQIGTGLNSASTGDVLTYRGGSDDRWGEDDGSRALSSVITRALDNYKGDFSVQGIRNSPGNAGMTTAQAQLINRDLATALNRNIAVKEASGNNDLSAEVNVGNLWAFDNGIEVGAIAGVNYDRKWRYADITSRVFSDPKESVEFEKESTFNVSLTGNLGFGLRINEQNYIETTSLFLRNTDDKTAIVDTFGADGNRFLSEGRADREYKIRYEQRELTVNQIHGQHEWGEDTRSLLDLDVLDELAFADGLKLDWYYSDSKASTDIPNEVSVEAETVADASGNALSSTVKAATKANYRFTELKDDVLSNGYTLTYPMEFEDFRVAISGGSDYWQKSRTYKQLQFAIDSNIAAGDPLLAEDLSTLYSDNNINNNDLGFEIDVTGSNSESYIAASKVNAYFGKVDATWNETIRLVVGLRYEEYQQVGLVWNPLEYNTSQISMDPQVLEDSVFINDDTYLSASATWIVPYFLAETFQLRFSFAETTIRPELRDISNSSYIDPLTGATVFGNPGVTPSNIDNFDIRAEWFVENNDSFTITAFYKKIDNPIEQFEKAAGGTKKAIEILNADSGKMTGVELEFLKSLEVLGDSFNSFFLQGNLVVLDHELTVGGVADSPTNEKRGFVGASDYSANLLLGFDSEDNYHSATLSYNIFAERLYAAGRLGSPDSFEQPFNSLDMTYSYYPINNFTVKLKIGNILDQSVTIEQDNVEIFKKEKGRSFSLSFKYDM